MNFRITFSARQVRRAKNKLIASQAISKNIPDTIRDNLCDLAKLGEILNKTKNIISLSRLSEKEKRIYIRCEVRLKRLSHLKQSHLARDMALTRRSDLLDMLASLSGISQSERYQELDHNNLMVNQVRQAGGMLPSDMPFLGPISGTSGMQYEIDPLVHGLTCPICLSSLDISDISGLSICYCSKCNTRIDIAKISASKFMAKLHNRGLINPIDPRSYVHFEDKNINDLARIQKNINEAKYMASAKEAKKNNNKSKRKNKSKNKRNKKAIIASRDARLLNNIGGLQFNRSSY